MNPDGHRHNTEKTAPPAYSFHPRAGLLLFVLAALIAILWYRQSEPHVRSVLSRYWIKIDMADGGVIKLSSEFSGEELSRFSCLLDQLTFRKSRSFSTPLTPANLRHISKLINRLDCSEVELDIGDFSEIENLDGLTGLRNLKSLMLRNCNSLQTLNGLSSHKGLKSLNVNFCFVLQNLDDLASLGRLQSLRLSYASFNTFTPARGLSSQQSLDLSTNQLRNTDYFGEIKTLETLDISDSYKLPNIDGLACLENFRKLDLAGSRLLKNGDVLREIPALKRLIIRGTSISDARLLIEMQNRIPDLQLDRQQSALIEEASRAEEVNDE